MTTNYNQFLDELDEFISGLDGMPDMLLMNRKMLSKLRGIARRAGYYDVTKDDFGRGVETYNGIALMDAGEFYDGTKTVDIVADTAAGSGTFGTSDIYAVKFGLDAFHGISPTGTKVITSYMPDLTQPGAVKKGEVELVARRRPQEHAEGRPHEGHYHSAEGFLRSRYAGGVARRDPQLVRMRLPRRVSSQSWTASSPFRMASSRRASTTASSAVCSTTACTNTRASDLTDEVFDGEVWALAVPKAVIDIATEIEAWRKANPDSAYTSESFGGYSYTTATASDGMPARWQDAFRRRLNRWRKLP